jgi:hypothetical protein
MATAIEAIHNFLLSRRDSHNGADLIDRTLDGALELQANVAAGNGEPVAEKRNTYTDGVSQWWNIRVPHNANSEPEWQDYVLTWPFDKHVEAIGSTGWDWKARRSKWVGFDFDSITGHATGVGISSNELESIRQRASALPWVEVRKSTGGSGLHLYVHLDVATANHTEHAALARAVLGLMATEAGFDFAAAVDCCGGNMWVWHRKATAANEGLRLLKAATETLAEPTGWREHLDVVTRKRSKVKLEEPGAEELATAHKAIPLDAKHRQIMQALAESGHSAVWVPDFHLLQTHTLAFRQVLEEKRESLGLHGLFVTATRASSAMNCFAFPLEDGAWKVIRFSEGAKEADTWEQDGRSWTWCYFNRKPSFAAACKALGGSEMPDHGFEFSRGEAARKAAELLGEKFDLPSAFADRIAYLHLKNGRLLLQVEKKATDEAMPSWSGSAKRRWSKLLGTVEEDEVDVDGLIRVLVSPAQENAGIFIRADAGTWDQHPATFVRAFLSSKGIADPEKIIGGETGRRWLRVCMPFQPEYPGNRQWNMKAARLLVTPSAQRDVKHPTWDMILAHNGQSLTPALRELEWARQANILTGGDYLRTLFACIIRHPYDPTPYIFEWGPENSGKSILWEAFTLLISGIIKADRILSSQNEFNGELEGAVVCVVEERDISKTPGALSRIKDYVTSPMLSIRRMRTDAYLVPNTTHWFQFSQLTRGESACPIFPGDTRITSIYVPKLEKEIAKPELLIMLKEEASQFMRTLLDMPLPPMIGRLRIPVVETEDKKRFMEESTPISRFLREKCVISREFWCEKCVLREAYKTWCRENELDEIDAVQFGKELFQLDSTITAGQNRINGVLKHCYRGVMVIDTGDTSDPLITHVDT